MAVRESIIETLDKAQSSTVHHSRLLKSLKALHDQTDLDEFLEAFVTPLCAALVIVKKEPVVERVLEFVAKFAASVAPLDPPLSENQEEIVEDSDEEAAREDEAEEVREGDDEEEGSEVLSSEEEDEELQHNFFNLLLAKLLSFHEASSRAVRFRSCQLVAKMLNCAFDRQCLLQGILLETVKAVMLERIHDKIPMVRVHAVQALELLQEEDVSVQLELVKVLERDPSADVRRAVLGIIVITDHTLPAILGRTRDVKDQIRKVAFWLLSEKCGIRNLRIEQRIKLLNDGLNDRSEMVRTACVNGLLHSWSRSLNGDLLSLLTKLDVESSPEVAELALTQLLAQIEVDIVVGSMVGLMDPTNRMESWEVEEEEGGGEERIQMPVTEKVIPYDLLNSEESFYWSCVCRYLHNLGDKGDEHIEKIVPTVSDFCEYVQCYVERELIPAEEVEEKVQKQFVCQQLLSIFSVLDLTDEVGKQRLAKMVLDLLVLPGLPTTLVTPLLALQTVLWPQPQHRVEKLLEVISDLRQPPLSATVCAGGVSQSTTLLSEDSQMANLSLLDIRSDPDTLCKCLTVATEMLKELRLRKLPVNLKTMVDLLVLPSVQNELPDIRDMALGCLGIACLHDITLARNHLFLFLQVSQVDHESVQTTAVKVVFDLLMVFGFEAFSLTSPATSSSKTPEGDTQADETLVEGETEGEDEKSVGAEGGEDEREGGEGGKGGEGEEESENDKTTQRILSIMANFIDGESVPLRGVAAEGMAKLLLSGRIVSQKLLARLLVLWVDPSTQDESRLRAVLGLFFPAFSASSRSCRVMLGEVFIPVMETVSEAPPNSPLRDANLNQIADFLVQLSAPQEPNEDSVHDSLAVDVANAVLSEPDNSILTRVYCRALTHMHLTTSNQSVAADLLVLLGHIEEQVRDKRSLQSVRKVIPRLRKTGGSSGKEGEGEGKGGEETEGHVDRVGVREDRGEEETVGDRGREEGEDKDDTLVAATPPRQHSPPEPTEKIPQKSTVRKTTKKSTKGKAPTKKTGKKKKKVIKDSDSSYGSSGEEAVVMNAQQLSSLPSRMRSTRAAKASARKLISDSILATPKGGKGGGQDESDDSLVGDHSPFIRQSARRTCGVGSIPMIDYDDDD